MRMRMSGRGAARLGWSLTLLTLAGCIEDPTSAADDAEPGGVDRGADAVVADAMRADGAPSDAMPADATPVDAMASDVMSSDIMPTDVMPTDVMPTDVMPTDVMPPDASIDGGPPAACPTTREGACDADRDDVPDAVDVCPGTPDPEQRDGDRDGLGDACDLDDDGDGILDAFDRCPWLPEDAGVADCAGDVDGDGVPDAQDRCPGRDDRAEGACARALDAVWWTKTATELRRDGDTMLVGTHGGLLRAGLDGALLDHWTTADGLTGNRVVAFEVDADGAVWVATDRGLSVVRPDGLVLPAAHVDERVDDVAVFDRAIFTLAGGRVWRHDPGGSAPFDPPVDGNAIDDAPIALMGTSAGVWRLSREGARRIAPDVAFADAALDALTPLRGGDCLDPAGPVWIHGDTGAAQLNPRTGQLGPIIGRGVVVHDVAVGDGAFELATPEGLRRVDTHGRLLPGPLPSEGLPPPLRSRWVAGAERAADGALWVATERGTVRVDGAASTYQAELPARCVTGIVDHTPLIWVGGAPGAWLIEPDGEVVALPGYEAETVRVIEAVDGAVWIATDDRISMHDAGGDPIGVARRGAELPDAPVTAITVGAVSDEGVDVWVGTDGGGLARRGADGVWQIHRAAPGGLPSDTIHALAYDDGRLWIATPLGLAHYDDAAGGFGGGAERIAITDLAAGGGRVYAATPQGLVVRQPDGVVHTLRRENGGLPDEAGTNEVAAVALDGDRLWLVMASSRRLPFGAALVRSPDPLTPGAFVAPIDAIGLPAAPTDGGVTLIARAGLGVGYAVCGGDVPGGAALIRGLPAIGAEVDDGGVPDGGPRARLVEGPGHAPMVTGATRGDAAFARVVAPDGIEPLALPIADAPPADCAAPSDGDDLWCSFPDVGFGRRLGNDQWNLGRLELIPALDPDLRAIVVEADVHAWIATAAGVIEVDGGSVRGHRAATTDRAIPTDDVRGVTLGGARLYAATAEGVAYHVAPSTWRRFDVEPLPSPSTRALAVDGEAVWIATDRGLAHRAANGGLLGDHGPADGLPAEVIGDVAVDGAGRVWAATDRGLARRAPDGHFEVLGPADGLPGRGAHALHVDADGVLWVQSDDGIARAAP